MKFRRTPVKVTVSYGTPAARPQFVAARPDLRTREQRLADQSRVDRLGFPRGAR